MYPKKYFINVLTGRLRIIWKPEDDLSNNRNWFELSLDEFNRICMSIHRYGGSTSTKELRGE